MNSIHIAPSLSLWCDLLRCFSLERLHMFFNLMVSIVYWDVWSHFGCCCNDDNRGGGPSWKCAKVSSSSKIKCEEHLKCFLFYYDSKRIFMCHSNARTLMEQFAWILSIDEEGLAMNIICRWRHFHFFHIPCMDKWKVRVMYLSAWSICRLQNHNIHPTTYDNSHFQENSMMCSMPCDLNLNRFPSQLLSLILQPERHDNVKVFVEHFFHPSCMLSWFP